MIHGAKDVIIVKQLHSHAREEEGWGRGEKRRRKKNEADLIECSLAEKDDARRDRVGRPLRANVPNSILRKTTSTRNPIIFATFGSCFYIIHAKEIFSPSSSLSLSFSFSTLEVKTQRRKREQRTIFSSLFPPLSSVPGDRVTESCLEHPHNLSVAWLYLRNIKKGNV